MNAAHAALEKEEVLIIETPERVPLHFALASLGNRFLACAFDHFLQVLLILVLIGIFQLFGNVLDNGFGLAEAPKWVQAVLIIVLFFLWSSYFTFFEWLSNGQTPGKRWLRLRVISEDGRPLTFWAAAVRNLLRTVDMMPAPFYSVGLVSVFISSRDQRAGDLVAGTVVVRERENEAPSFAEVFAAPVSDSALRRVLPVFPFTANLQSVTNKEIEVVEQYLRRRFDLPDTAREWMAWRVATPLLYKLRPRYDEKQFKYEAFLEELLHRYHAERRFKN